ncbi:MAG: Holliday junction resolvase RuvX [Candidatus Krumholzibacteria bacterium]|nr:Holliday junction resolvase RuvX [Candidatus Krumholzibacteria bacterium]
MRERPRILGIDPGARRVGLAVSDPLGITAQGLETFDRRRDGDLFARLAELIAGYEVAEVVVGHPLSLSGRPGAAAQAAAALAREIERRLGVRVVLWDERLSTAEAERTLAGTRARKGAADRVAAVIILQGYLDRQRASGGAEEA